MPVLLPALPARGRVSVTGGREWRHEDPEPGHAGPPAEVEIVVVAVEPFVERSRPLPGLPRHEHHRGGHEQDLEHAVVLALVALSFLERRVRVAEPVGRAADLAQDPRIVPVDDLRTHDADPFDALDAFGRLEQAGDGVRGERRVVVHEEQVVGGLRGGKIRRRGEGSRDAEVLTERDHPALSERLLEELHGAVARPVVHGDDAQTGMALLGERPEALAEPSRGVSRDEHGEHAR